VYCYEHCGGWFQIHVASRRRIFKQPLPPPVDFRDAQGLVARWFAVDKIIDEHSEMVDIGLPYDGKDFQESTPGDAAARLVMLREAGYVVPQFAIDTLLEEQQTWKSASE
jgi:hypothetical protein